MTTTAGARFAAAGALLVGLACGGGPPQRVEGPAPAGGGGPSGQGANAWFEDVARESGLRFTYESGHRERHWFPEIIGGGAALFDADGDGDLDAYLVQGGSLERPGKIGNQLFLNDGAGRFRDASAGSGSDDRGYGMGVTAGDHDNDGDVDLYVTNVGRNTLLRNDGDGRFTDVTEAAGVGDPGWSTSAAFFDADADGDLDLFVANYVVWSMATEKDCYGAGGLHDYCLPTNYVAPAPDRLYRNDGDGTFTDVTEAAGLLRSYGNGLGVVCADFDGDGRTDVFVANDTMMNQLWLNQGGGRFTDESLMRGCAVDENGTAKAGMGVAAGDVDDDQDLDLLVVNLRQQTDSLFLNEGGVFTDRTVDTGLGVATLPFTRFGVGLVDFDDDGVLDLYHANGKVGVIGMPEGDPYAEVNVVLQGLRGGRFQEVLPRGGTAAPLVATSRAAAFGDVDGDGGVDVLVVNRDGPAYLLRNVVPDRGSWIAFRVLEEHDRDALGAVLRIEAGGRKLRRDVQSGSSYLASSDPRVHVGLDEATRVDRVKVRWVDGTEEWFGPFDAGQVVELRRGAGVAG